MDGVEFIGNGNTGIPQSMDHCSSVWNRQSAPLRETGSCRGAEAQRGKRDGVQ